MLECGFYEKDCLEGMPLIAPQSIDLILSDMPYGLTRCAWDRPLDLQQFWAEALRIIKPHGAVILTAKQPYTTDLINSCRELFRYTLVWVKNISTGYLNAKTMPLQSHEDICVFYRHKPTYNPQMEHGFERKVSKASSRRKCKAAEIYNKAANLTDYDSTDRYPISLLYFESDKHRKALHPTQKPLDLFIYLIRTYSNPSDIVLDCCAGSNTTGVACLATGRRYIGFEKDHRYYETGKARAQNTARILYGGE